MFTERRREGTASMARTQDMTAGSPVRLILIFALPILAGNLLQQLYSLIDSLIIGQLLGVTALTAVSASGWLDWAVLSIPMGLAQGYSIHAAQCYGGKRYDELKRTVAQSYLISTAVTVILEIFSQTLLHPVLTWMNSPEETKIVPLVYLSPAFGVENVPWHSNQPPRMTSGSAPPHAPVRMTVPPVSMTSEPAPDVFTVFFLCRAVWVGIDMIRTVIQEFIRYSHLRQKLICCIIADFPDRFTGNEINCRVKLIDILYHFCDIGHFLLRYPHRLLSVNMLPAVFFSRQSSALQYGLSAVVAVNLIASSWIQAERLSA